MKNSRFSLLLLAALLIGAEQTQAQPTSPPLGREVGFLDFDHHTIVLYQFPNPTDPPSKL